MSGVGGSERRKDEPVRLDAHEVPYTTAPAGEVFDEGDKLVASFYLPAHNPPDVKFHVGRRTITLWSRKEQCVFQTIVVLPRWVNSDTYLLRHQNGVYEFVLDSPAQPAIA